MKVEKSDFGAHNNHNIDLYTLTNDNGMEVKIMNYGATITSISIPTKEGKRDDIVCGFDTFEGYFSDAYKTNAPYFGSIVGRYSSQIKDSKFTLNGKEYKIADNCGANNLHGGVVGFDKKIWQAARLDVIGGVAVKMSLTSLSMEEGFPGNVNVSVIFGLNNDNELSVSYAADTDADTPLSLTNHTYFNLSGFKNSIEDHSVSVYAGNKLEMDETGAATGVIVDLDDAVDDLRLPQLIGDVHKKMNDGFEHYYIFDKDNFELEKVAEFKNKEDNRSLEVSTSEPGMLFYTGKYTSNDLKRESGNQYGKYRAFCCETHRFPNGPNIENSPKSITKAGEKFESKTVFKLTWEDNSNV